MRLSGLVFLSISLGLWTAACTSNPKAVECATGIFCPEGFHCAAAEQKCIADTNSCGDAITDPGEECDDGNLVAGDGCSPTCKAEVCGNSVMDPGEECDDGNKDSGDGCSSTCKKEFCGNMVTDPGEVCDEGPAGGPHCNATCTSDLSCGNGILDPGEACDVKPQDLSKCSADCKSSRACGNGILDPGEECDNGSTDSGNGIFNANNQDCREDCVFNRCGDGYQNTAGQADHREQCDAAPMAAQNSRAIVPTETSGCNLDCTTPHCGDGKVNQEFGEECDDGANNGDDKDCTAGCKVARCGDGLWDQNGTLHHEACDDGNASNTDGCSTSCTTPLCGNGVIDQNEQCDLGMGNNTLTSACPNCQLAKCGDGNVHAGVEECDGTAGLQPCDNTTCKQQKCGNGIIDPGEDCDDHNNTNGDGCTSACKFEVCGDGVKNQAPGKEACDTAGNTATCDVDCTAPSCGDGIVNAQFKPAGAATTEQCDPPNVGHGCSALCQFEGCGNGVVDPGEQCDGAAVGGFQCVNCHLDKCGNGVVDADEQCDDGNNVATDGCISNDPTPAKCKFNVCGDGVKYTGVEECDDGALNGTASSPNHCDQFCHTNKCGNGVIEAGEGCDDGAGNNGNGKHCNGSCQLNTCGDSDVYAGEEQCDKGGDTNQCDSDCTLPVCGDGHKNTAAGEQCDDGSKNGTPASPNNCSINCKLQGCGNGVLDPGEQCDPGVVGMDKANCNADCTFPDCGDGHTNSAAGETCDDGEATNGAPCPYGTKTCTHCNSSCSGMATFTGPFCGDNVKESSESCDDGNTTTETAADCPYGTTCTTFCKADCSGAVPSLSGGTCGDGIVQSPDEVCDDKNTTCGACASDCSHVTLAPASAVMFAPSGSQLANMDNFTLSDGFGNVVKFQFYTMTAPGGATVGIMFDPADTATQIRTKIVSAITGSSLGITPVATAAGFITLTNTKNGVKGNTMPTNNVATANFAITNFTGGQGGDCGALQACTSGADCASGTCTLNKCL